MIGQFQRKVKFHIGILLIGLGPEANFKLCYLLPMQTPLFVKNNLSLELDSKHKPEFKMPQIIKY